MSKRTIEPVDGIPIRLRRRRDGSMALTDHRGAVDAESYQAPSEHLFLYSWLMGAGSSVARVIDGTITVTLANASLTYQAITDEDERVQVMSAQADHRGNLLAQPEAEVRAVALALSNQGILARFVKGKVSDPPPIDEKAAESLQASKES